MWGGVYFILQLLGHTPWLREIRNSRQDLDQKPQRNTAYQLVPHGLPSLLSFTAQDNLPPSELGPPTVIINKENIL